MLNAGVRRLGGTDSEGVCVHVCVCMCVCACVWMHACVCVSVRACVCVCVWWGWGLSGLGRIWGVEFDNQKPGIPYLCELCKPIFQGSHKINLYFGNTLL